MAITLPADLLERMRAHAAATSPHEACGAVFGRRTANGRWRATHYQPLANVAAHPTAAFAIDPFEFLRVDGAHHDAGRALLGIFHSHPRGGSTPSSIDRTAEWPGVACWIAAPDAEGRWTVHAHPTRTRAQNRIV